MKVNNQEQAQEQPEQQSSGLMKKTLWGLGITACVGGLVAYAGYQFFTGKPSEAADTVGDTVSAFLGK